MSSSSLQQAVEMIRNQVGKLTTYDMKETLNKNYVGAIKNHFRNDQQKSEVTNYNEYYFYILKAFILFLLLYIYLKESALEAQKQRYIIWKQLSNHYLRNIGFVNFHTFYKDTQRISYGLQTLVFLLE